MQTVELRQIKLHEIKHSDANKAIIDTPLEKPSKVAQDTSPKQLLKSEEKHVKLTKWSKKQASSKARPARGEA